MINGQNLRKARIKDGQSRNQLAGTVKISVTYLSDIEAGRRTLKRNPGLIKRLAQACDVPLSWITYQRDPEPAASKTAVA